MPVHADHIGRDGSRLSLLILPNLAAMSDDQVTAVRGFVQRGKGLIATGQTGLFNEWGDARVDFGLGDLLGIKAAWENCGAENFSTTEHSYLRLDPDVGRDVYGPRSGEEPQVSKPRPAVLAGFEETNILPFGGRLEKVVAQSGTEVPLTFIPEFPIYPPETSWMREPRTDLPALVLRTVQDGSRPAYLAADIDRRFAADNLPDHGDLLANLVRWAVKGDVPIQVEGPGLIDCHLYRQPGRLILHLVNLTSSGTWRSPLHELIPVGPVKVKVKLEEGVEGGTTRSLVSDVILPATIREGRCSFRVDSIVDHEVVVIGTAA